MTIRSEFKVLIERCGCSQAYLDGKCEPSKCFPELYKLAYPKGGCSLKSYMSTHRRKKDA